MAYIKAEGLAVDFPLYHVGSRSLKKRLFAAASRRVEQDAQDRVVVAALRDLNFSIKSGERVALIGHNGAGKSTLLRTIAGIYDPVGGRLEVQGAIGSLIDPMAGMDPWATGFENIRLRAWYRGLSDAQAKALAAEVVSFSGLNEFLDIPVRSYSAGMQVRLAFAMATAMAPDILLMDEWFLAGDADFMARAEERLAVLVRDAEILVLATHAMEIVRRWCTRVIRMDGGRIIHDGTVEEVLGPEVITPPAAAVEPAPPSPAG
jgi:lipopolysaccharide transport system ATP-binding protein